MRVIRRPVRVRARGVPLKPRRRGARWRRRRTPSAVTLVTFVMFFMMFVVLVGADGRRAEHQRRRQRDGKRNLVVHDQNDSGDPRREKAAAVTVRLPEDPRSRRLTLRCLV